LTGDKKIKKPVTHFLLYLLNKTVKKAAGAFDASDQHFRSGVGVETKCAAAKHSPKPLTDISSACVLLLNHH